MTNAQAFQTQRATWQGLLVAVGGTPVRGDTLHSILRKILELYGAPPAPRAALRRMAESILAINPNIYSSDGRLNSHLLPQAGTLRWGIDPSSGSPALGSSMAGNPDTGEVAGNPDTGETAGRPES